MNGTFPLQRSRNNGQRPDALAQVNPLQWAEQQKVGLDELTERFHRSDWRVCLTQKLPGNVTAEQAAGKCLELVAIFPDQVITLLEARPEVAQAAIDLLPSIQDPEQGALLALALLAANRSIPRHEGLPDSVKQVLPSGGQSASQQVQRNEQLAGTFMASGGTEFANALAQGDVSGMKAASESLPFLPIHVLARPLSKAMHDGHAGAIEFVGRLLSECKLTRDDWKLLFFTTANDVSPDLVHAVKKGDVDTIQAVGDIMLQSRLHADDWADILQLLSYAAQQGQAGAVTALGGLLMRSPLGTQDKVGARSSLLQREFAPGIPCFPSAIQRGDAPTVRAIGNLLPQLKLRHDDLKAIVLGKNTMQVSALKSAYELEHNAVLRAYAEMVVGLQQNAKTRLRGANAQQVLDYMRDAQNESKSVPSIGYLRLEVEDPELYTLIKSAKALLKEGLKSEW